MKEINPSEQAAQGTERTVRRLTNPPAHHFFGYYGMSPWNKTLTRHLALESAFQDHRPDAGDSASAGVVDTGTGQFCGYGRTAAFNLQQGSMMHWIEAGFGEEFTYNDWEDHQLVTRTVNPETAATRTLQGALAAVSPVDKLGVGLNFQRMAGCRAVVGYASARRDLVTEFRPRDDGLYLLDLVSGKKQLLLAIDEVIRANPMAQNQEGLAWFNHVYFRPDGKRILFLCRVKRAVKWYSSMWSVGVNGSDLRCLIDYRFYISHFFWRDNSRIIVSTDYPDHEARFIEIADGERGYQLFGQGALPQDGHLSFSPDGQWATCDTYPMGKERLSQLMLYHDQTRVKIMLGQFHADEQFTGDIRCDLHPRWRPDGQEISFDSVHEGTRQIYTISINDIINPKL